MIISGFIGVCVLLFGPLVSSAGNVTLYAQREPLNFTSPNYPGTYMNNDNCYWDIYPQTIGNSVVLDMVFSDIEGSTGSTCPYDALTIYVKNNGDQRIDESKRMCGQSRLNLITSEDQHIHAVFETDDSVNRAGFQIRYYEIDDCATDEEINEYEPKYIESPNHPLQYPSNANCSWTISTRLEGYVIHVQVVHFYLEQDSPCSYDYVHLYDVTGTYERSLGRWCGSDGPDTQSTGMSMKVRFHSDSSSTFKGFKLAFTACEPTSSSSVTPNVGGIIGGVFGGIVGVAIVTCCCCGICSRKKSTTNDQSQGNRSREANMNTVYTVSVYNYPPTTATTHHDMNTPPPAYSEVVKDDPPPYCQVVQLSDIQPVVTSSPNGASSYQGIDNPAGPS